ncbi:esterase/lipase family protein [Haloferula sp.]|uniref:esterase/lipase family protein n=1 Tax=Haloferula sp. TaxID=2497595 RepID=UPI003C77C643
MREFLKNVPSRLLIVVVMTILPGCMPRDPRPALGEIYNPTAQRIHVDRNPIIVVPGVMGSKLVDAQGNVVWGVFGPGGIDHRSADGMRSMALPVSASGWPRDDVRPDGALEELHVSLGFNFHFKAYSRMLAAFGAGGYIDPAHIETGGVEYGDEHFTCFQFAYDWRRSNAENAAKLDQFIEEKARYVERERKRRYGITKKVKFDVIAHSMGGLVARYHLMYGGRQLSADGRMPVTWAGANRVEKLILVGTPNGGSVYAFENLEKGLKLSPLLPTIKPAVIGTMPSAYELLPPGGDGALIDQHSVAIDYYNVDEWERRGWGLMNPEQDEVLAKLMPDVGDPAARRSRARDQLKKMLENARSFHRAMNLPVALPDGVELFAFVGDAVSTASRIQVQADGKMELIDWIAGDGTVTRKSVMRDMRTAGEAGSPMRGPIKWTGAHFVFTDHVGMTADPAFVDNVLYLLLERP